MNLKTKIIRHWVIYIVIIIATLEISPYLLGKFFLANGFSRSEIRKELYKYKVENPDKKQDPEKKNMKTNEYLGNHLLSPYLGFVHVPGDAYNTYGFLGPDPVIKNSDTTVNVCITGGSVAKQLYLFSLPRIIDNLKKIPDFSKKQINVVLLALGGFKQPQQLLAVNYMMALGAQYDIVINLDGFNEIVLPYSDNLPFHVFPSYPRHWEVYSQKRLDQKVILQLGRQAVYESRLTDFKEKLINSLLNRSNFILFLWKIYQQNLNNKILISEELIRIELKDKDLDYQSTGPFTEVADTTVFFRQQALFWSRSSIQLADLSKAGDFKYFHFLQPNQYVKGSKMLTKEEKEVAYQQGTFNYKEAVINGYPYLIEEGEKLKKEGVNFFDLTGIFSKEKKTVYADKCCHFNQFGYDQIADSITNIIIRSYQ